MVKDKGRLKTNRQEGRAKRRTRAIARIRGKEKRGKKWSKTQKRCERLEEKEGLDFGRSPSTPILHDQKAEKKGNLDFGLTRSWNG